MSDFFVGLAKGLVGFVTLVAAGLFVATTIMAALRIGEVVQKKLFPPQEEKK